MKYRVPSNKTKIKLHYKNALKPGEICSDT
jgi:hypothetical protein